MAQVLPQGQVVQGVMQGSLIKVEPQPMVVTVTPDVANSMVIHFSTFPSSHRPIHKLSNKEPVTSLLPPPTNIGLSHSIIFFRHPYRTALRFKI